MFNWFNKQKYEDDGFDFIQEDESLAAFVNDNLVETETIEEILKRIDMKLDKLMEILSDG